MFGHVGGTDVRTTTTTCQTNHWLSLMQFSYMDTNNNDNDDNDNDDNDKDSDYDHGTNTPSSIPITTS